MRFDLGQKMRHLLAPGIAAIGQRHEAADLRAFEHGCVIRIGHHRAGRVCLVRLAHHAEQRQGLRLAIHGPRRIENLVSAMLGIRLRKHHQFNIRRIAPELAETLQQIIHFVSGQRQAQRGIRRRQRSAATGQNVHDGQRLRRDMRKQCLRLIDGIEHGFGHAIMEPSRQHRLFIALETGHMKRRATLDTRHLRETTITRDVRRLGAPWRNRPHTRRHQQQFASRRVRSYRGDAQQFLEPGNFISARRCQRLDEIPVFGGDAGGRVERAYNLLQTRETRRRKRSSAAQRKEFSHNEKEFKRRSGMCQLYPCAHRQTRKPM
nr:L415 [uncultured bacterium]